MSCAAVAKPVVLWTEQSLNRWLNRSRGSCDRYLKSAATIAECSLQMRLVQNVGGPIPTLNFFVQLSPSNFVQGLEVLHLPYALGKTNASQHWARRGSRRAALLLFHCIRMHGIEEDGGLDSWKTTRFRTFRAAKHRSILVLESCIYRRQISSHIFKCSKALAFRRASAVADSPFLGPSID